MTEKMPPHSVPMEQAVLGCCLSSRDCLESFIGRFRTDEVFYDVRHKPLYFAIRELFEEKQAVDAFTVSERLKSKATAQDAGGEAYVHSLLDSFASTANFDSYADAVAEQYTLRKTVASCTEAVSMVYENAEAAEVVDHVQKRLETLRDLRASEQIVTAKKGVTLLTNYLEERFKLQGQRSGVVTGLMKLDQLTDGIQYGEQSVIGARPSQGKTALATTIVRRACLGDQVPTLVVTLEMSIQSLLRRMLSSHTGISLQTIRRGEFSENAFKAFTAFNALVARSPLYFVDAVSGSSCGRIAAGIRKAVKAHGVKLVVIDYLQKIHADQKHEKRTYEVGSVSGALKGVAVETGVAMLTLAQLSREPDKQKGRAPNLSDLADSAQIERDADTVILLERKRDEDETLAKLYVAKQRDGEVGTVELKFNPELVQFENKSLFED